MALQKNYGTLKNKNVKFIKLLTEYYRQQRRYALFLMDRKFGS